jgi:hypothetical protein
MADYRVELVLLTPYELELEAADKKEVAVKVATLTPDDLLEIASLQGEGRVSLGRIIPLRGRKRA